MCTTWYFLVWNSESLGKSWLPPSSDMLTGSIPWLPCEQCGCCRLQPCADIKASDSMPVPALKSHTFPKAPSGRNDSAILTSPRYDISKAQFSGGVLPHTCWVWTWDRCAHVEHSTAGTRCFGMKTRSSVLQEFCWKWSPSVIILWQYFQSQSIAVVTLLLMAVLSLEEFFFFFAYSTFALC